MDDHADNQSFLENFPPTERGWINNLFLDSIRKNGASSAVAVVSYVAEVTQRKIYSALAYGAYEQLEKLNALQDALLDHLEAATAQAEAALAYERLTPAERQARKERQAEAHRQAHMASLPATTAQVNYLRSLGYNGPVENRAQASQLIEQYRRRHAA